MAELLVVNIIKVMVHEPQASFNEHRPTHIKIARNIHQAHTQITIAHIFWVPSHLHYLALHAIPVDAHVNLVGPYINSARHTRIPRVCIAELTLEHWSLLRLGLTFMRSQDWWFQHNFEIIGVPLTQIKFMNGNVANLRQ